uniref:Uncharacterized protein n=1 Tax=Tanacetum cinerariifolium TaxID=118510 RepID=A0A6L2KVQ9_TANCI|nr:hypothetical protein [Tanacetum cinerariifolium]
MERGFLSPKGRGVGRGVKEKHDSMVGESVVVGVHGNVVLGSISNSRTMFDVNADLEYPTISEAHGTQAQTSASKESMNEVGTTTGSTMVGIAHVESIQAVSERFPNTAYVFSWESGRHTLLLLTIAMIELRADVELKDNNVVAMPKISREGHYKCNILVECEWKHPSGNKKKGVDHTDKVSDSNPFEVLNLVENDVETGTNEGTSNPDNNEANSTILVDETGNPLKKVESPGNQDTEDEVASVDNDMARSLASKRT